MKTYRISRHSIFLIITLLGAALMLLNGCGIMQRIPVPEATTPTATPAPTEDLSQATPRLTPVGLTTRTPNPLSTEETEWLPGVCDKKDAITLLLLGIDENNQADAIRLVRIDFGRQEVNMVAIPRDFYIQTVEFEEQGIEYSRINATFGYGQLYLGRGKGAQAMADNIAHNFGVPINEQYVVYFEQIEDYINAIGGISVYLEKPASDDFSFFPAGLNVMDGETAVTFMRMRLHDNDFERIRRQTLVLEALLEKVRNGLSFDQITYLIGLLLSADNSQSSLSLKDMYDLYCFSTNVDMENFHTHEIPSGMYHVFITPSGGWTLLPHEEVPQFLQESLKIDVKP